MTVHLLHCDFKDHFLIKSQDKVVVEYDVHFILEVLRGLLDVWCYFHLVEFDLNMCESSFVQLIFFKNDWDLRVTCQYLRAETTGLPPGLKGFRSITCLQLP